MKKLLRQQSLASVRSSCNQNNHMRSFPKRYGRIPCKSKFYYRMIGQREQKYYSLAFREGGALFDPYWEVSKTRLIKCLDHFVLLCDYFKEERSQHFQDLLLVGFYILRRDMRISKKECQHHLSQIFDTIPAKLKNLPGLLGEYAPGREGLLFDECNFVTIRVQPQHVV